MYVNSSAFVQEIKSITFLKTKLPTEKTSGLDDFTSESAVNKCNFLLMDTYGHIVDIQ